MKIKYSFTNSSEIFNLSYKIITIEEIMPYEYICILVIWYFDYFINNCYLKCIVNKLCS